MEEITAGEPGSGVNQLKPIMEKSGSAYADVASTLLRIMKQLARTNTTSLHYSVFSINSPSSRFFPLISFHRAYVFAPSSMQIAGALSAIVILFITLWIGTLFEDLPKVLVQEQKKLA